MPQNKPQDKFWKLYLSIVGLFTLALIGTGVFLFNTASGDYTSGDVLGLHDERIVEFPFVEVPSVYKDALTRGWEDSSWEADIAFDAVAPERRGDSVRVFFRKEYAGFGLYAPHFDTSPYGSISFSVYVGDNASSSLFIEMNDKDDKLLGTQLLSWYLPEKKWKTNSWNEVLVPLTNVNAEKKSVTSISIVSAEPGVFFVDDIEWKIDAPAVVPWKEGANIETPVTPLLLPFKADFYKKTEVWQTASGKSLIEFSKMRIETGTSTNYAAVILKGSQFWIDYRATFGFDWGTGDSVNLIARRSDDMNYFSCSFYDDGDNVTLYQIQNGKQIELDSAPNFTRHRKYDWAKTKTLSIEVKGNSVACLSGDKELVRHTARSPYPIIGEVGIELWSPKPSQSAVSVNTVNVEVK